MKCEACHSDTEYKIEGHTAGFFCTQCDWAVVSTLIPEIEVDKKKYTIYLLHANYHNKKHIRVLSQVANINYLQARKMAQESQPIIVTEQARKVDIIRKILDKVAIKYKIYPEFPYLNE